MPAIDYGKPPEELRIAQLRDMAHHLLVAQADAAETYRLMKEYQQLQAQKPDSPEAIAAFREAQQALHEMMHDLTPEGTMEEWSDEKHAVGP